jgi:hypothetical protein
MTRYSLAVVILPVLGFLAAGFPGRRALLPLVAGVVFLGACAPWLARNWDLSGNPFGIAAYDAVKETPFFEGDWLDRTMNPNLGKVSRSDIVRKLFVGADKLLREDLPQLGGSWLAAFFLVGLLVPFVDPARRRLRWFTLGSLVLTGLAQVMARTHLSESGDPANPENLLMTLTPLVFMFGAALLVLLVSSMDRFW